MSWSGDKEQLSGADTIGWNFLKKKKKMDGSSKNKHGKARGGGLLRDSQGRYIKGFSIHIGTTWNNIAKIFHTYSGVFYGTRAPWTQVPYI